MDLLTTGVVFADAPDDPWLQPVRTWQSSLLRRARTAVAESALLLGDPASAAATARAAIEEDPFDESAYRTLMNAYKAAHEPARVVRAYQRLRAVLAHELGIEPAPPTRELYVEILRQNLAPLSPTGRIDRP